MVMAFSKFILNEALENYILMHKRKVGSRETALWEKVSASKPNDVSSFWGLKLCK